MSEVMLPNEPDTLKPEKQNAKPNGSVLFYTIRLGRSLITSIAKEAAQVPLDIFKGINKSTIPGSGQTITQK